jgi:carboxyl-terminal processing protease
MKDNDFYVTQFEKYLSKIGIALNLNKNNAIVYRYITAEFARQLFGENQYYQIVLKEDTMIKAVLKH